MKLITWLIRYLLHGPIKDYTSFLSNGVISPQLRSCFVASVPLLSCKIRGFQDCDYEV